MKYQIPVFINLISLFTCSYKQSRQTNCSPHNQKIKIQKGHHVWWHTSAPYLQDKLYEHATVILT